MGVGGVAMGGPSGVDCWFDVMSRDRNRSSECWAVGDLARVGPMPGGSVGPPWQQRVASMWVVVFGCPDLFFALESWVQDSWGFPQTGTYLTKHQTMDQKRQISQACCVVPCVARCNPDAPRSGACFLGRTHPSSWHWWLQGQGCAGARCGVLGCAGATARRSPGSRCSSTRTHCKLRCLAPRWSPMIKSKQTKPKHDSTRLDSTDGQDRTGLGVLSLSPLLSCVLHPPMRGPHSHSPSPQTHRPPTHSTTRIHQPTTSSDSATRPCRSLLDCPPPRRPGTRSPTPARPSP